MKLGQSYVINKADIEKDKKIIMEICSNNLSEMQEKRFIWKYENNPHGKASCWLAKYKEQNAFVGAAALFPRRILINGKYHMGGKAGDFAINKNHRGFGPAILMQKTILSDFRSCNFDILYGIPNEQSISVLKRVGYRIIGNNVWMTKPIRSRNYLQRYIPFEIAVKILSKLVDIIIKLFSMESYHKKRKSYSFEVVASFDERFDDLWNKASESYSIIEERRSGYLSWRFLQHPFKTYEIFALTRMETNEVLGYIVSLTSDNHVRIVDLLTLDSGEIFDSLLSEFLRYHRRKNIDSVSIVYFGNENLVSRLKKYCFIITNRETKTIGFADANSQIFTVMNDKDNWYLFEGDEDV